MSTLKVGTIQDHANSNTAMTIDSGGRPVLAGQACVAVQCTNTGKFGKTTVTLHTILLIKHPFQHLPLQPQQPKLTEVV